jgi:hypothetical protein
MSTALSSGTEFSLYFLCREAISILEVHSGQVHTPVVHQPQKFIDNGSRKVGSGFLAFKERLCGLQLERVISQRVNVLHVHAHHIYIEYISHEIWTRSTVLLS